MPIVDYWKRCVLERYADFSGRSRRAEYWWFYLGNVIIFAVLGSLAQVSGIFMVLYVVAALAVFIPGLAVSIRRLHDIDRSGWGMLLALTGIGAIILLVWNFTDGTRGPNKYGPSEKYPN
jgi:uncharacterized membrane protein YhaH (DUF805 family)